MIRITGIKKLLSFKNGKLNAASESHNHLPFYVFWMWDNNAELFHRKQPAAMSKIYTTGNVNRLKASFRALPESPDWEVAIEEKCRRQHAAMSVIFSPL